MFLDLERPATHKQITASLSEAGLKAGILDNLASDDLRRGATKDLTTVYATRRPNQPSFEVAAHLGNSRQSFHSSVIGRHYFEHFLPEVWTDRVTKTSDDPFGLGPTTVAFKKRRVTHAEYTKMCGEQDVRPDDKRTRESIRDDYREEEISDWRKNGGMLDQSDGDTFH